MGLFFLRLSVVVAVSFSTISVASVPSKAKQGQVLAIVGGTIVDVDDYGTSHDDLSDTVVIVKAGKITQIGSVGQLSIPVDAKVIDAAGKYIVPGLIDGFATVNNQAYANAFLYSGVTTIIAGHGSEKTRRGFLFRDANPSPKIHTFSSLIGVTPTDGNYQNSIRKTDEELTQEITEFAEKGDTAILIHYFLTPHQVELAVKLAEQFGMATIGELSGSSFEKAIELGVQSFVHTSRYSADIVPAELRKAYTKAPFFSQARRDMRQYFQDIAPRSHDGVLTQAKIFGSAKVGLMPTAAMYYPTLPYAKNPWQEPIAKTIDAKDIHLPVDKRTGKWVEDVEIMRTPLSLNQVEFDRVNYEAGAKFLLASGTDAFGTIPGVSTHIELEMFSRIGLSNREVIATATSNFSDIYGWDDIGKIEEGREADILILDANPLDDLKNLKRINHLVLNGELIDLKAMLPN